MSQDTDALKLQARSLGFDLVGVCAALPAPHAGFYRGWLDRGFHGTMDYLERQVPLKRSPTELLPAAKTVVAVGLNYARPNPTRVGFPRIASYALGRDYHRVLRGKLKKLAKWIEEEHPGSKCRACVDSTPVFERDYAHLAGLGWFGKNTCLIDSKRGSWFFIGLLITTVEFAADQPAIGGCGNCRLCIDACPTGAIVFADGRWQVDSRSCISYLTIEHRGVIDSDLASKFGDWTFGCDVCQEVCPFNQPRETQPLRAISTTEPGFVRPTDWPTLLELAELSEDRWDELTTGSAIRRTGLEGIRRNARINLTNRPPT